MVHEAELVVSEGVPRVRGGDRSSGFAALALR
jgi:hypothetical protein